MSEQAKLTTRQRAYQTIMVVFAISLGLAGVSSLPVLFKLIWSKGAALAVVNDLPVTQQEYMRKVRMEQHKIQAYRQQFGEAASQIFKALGMSENPREAALEQLINDKVVLSVAQRLHMQLAPAYVGKKISDPTILYNFFGDGLPSVLFNQQTKQIDYTKLGQFLSRQGMTMRQFEEAIEDTIKEYMTLALVQGAAVVSPAALEKALLQKFAPKAFTMTKLPLAQFLKVEQAKSISDEELAGYYAQVQEAYQAPEKRAGNVWVFKKSGYALAAAAKEASDKEEKFSEQFNKDMAAVMNAPEMAVTALARQKNGVKKALAAQELRENEQNPVVKQLFGLSVGRRGFFVEGDTGYLVELIKVEKGAALPLAQVKEKVMADLRKERALQALEKHISEKSDWAGEKASSIAWKPGNDQAFEAWRKEGVAVERIKKMFAVGQELVGFASDFAYRVKVDAVSAVDAQVADKERASLQKELAAEAAQQTMYEFIASSREHATIVMNTALLEQQP